MLIAENLEKIRRQIDKACAKVGRKSEEILLLPVSKTQPIEKIEEMAALGVTTFGENKVQEAKGKKALCTSRISWHMIGHLQTNKCRDALQTFAMIQSVDSVDLACELNKWADKLSRRIPILLEVNIAGEATKFGFKPEKLISELAQLNSFARLEILGLMTIAPWTSEPEKVRPIFRALRNLKSECEQQLGAPLPHLSMGMSGDFEVAIEEGSTIVRIGTALFGPRQTARPKAD